MADPLAGTEIAPSILALVGNTPLVAISKLSRLEGVSATLAIKLETMNPGMSAKDRIAIAMIDAAERDGLLLPGGTIVEPTSGNTGVGLAIVAAQRGYKCVFVVTDKVSPAKIARLRAYGAEVVVCSVALAPDDPNSYYSTAERLSKEIPGAFRPNQYANPNNPLAHERTTGPEIWRQTAGRVTHLVAGMGTGGTITGTTRYLKQQNASIVSIGADSESSVYTGGSGRPYLVEGIGEDFYPETIDLTIIDQKIAVTDEAAFLMARRLAKTEGIFLGGSGGAAVYAAIESARALNEQHLVVIVIPDSGWPSLGREYDDAWMAQFGFLRGEGRTVAKALEVRGNALPRLLYVNPKNYVREAIELMRKHEVSQLPVCKNEPPFATSEVIGSVDELRLMDLTFNHPEALDRTVDEVMGERLPMVGIGQPLSLAVELLDRSPALLVLSSGRPRSILTRSDVLRCLDC